MLDAFNTGNPVVQMVNDARMAAASIDYFAGLVTEIKGQTIPMGPKAISTTRCASRWASSRASSRTTTR